MLTNRRTFLEQVGQGALVAGLGSTLAVDLGLASLSSAAEDTSRLSFGKREPLVRLLQETPPAKILPAVIAQINKGTTLDDLVGAAALANARNFGGEDYIGYHTMMALAPALTMSRELPTERRALPVLKVLYRNSERIEKRGGKEVLTPIEAATLPKDKTGTEALATAVHSRKVKDAEQTFAAIANKGAQDALDELLPIVEENTEVHRIVLAYRSWEMLDLIGKEHAQTMLRQSVRYCVNAERWPRRDTWGDSRKVIAGLLEKHKLLRGATGKKKYDDAGVETLAQTIFKSKPEHAAGAVAEALADGMAPDAIGEALTLASCELLLRDEGRPKGQTSPGKPIGSVHGDSIGVHAMDSANAWRNLARVGTDRNVAACLILGAFQVALDRVNRGGDFMKWVAYPRPEHLEKVEKIEKKELLGGLHEAIKGQDQARAAALVSHSRANGISDKELFGVLLGYAISEDGALHAEKFYRTTSDEYATSREKFRGRYLVALARVTASAYGQAAPGHKEACKLLKV